MTLAKNTLSDSFNDNIHSAINVYNVITTAVTRHVVMCSDNCAHIYISNKSPHQQSLRGGIEWHCRSVIGWLLGQSVCHWFGYIHVQ